MDVIKIMPCLDMKDGRVVKGIHFVEIRDAGDPVENAAFYQEEGADELAMLDIAARHDLYHIHIPSPSKNISVNNMYIPSFFCYISHEISKNKEGIWQRFNHGKFPMPSGRKLHI